MAKRKTSQKEDIIPEALRASSRILTRIANDLREVALVLTVAASLLSDQLPAKKKGARK